MYLGAVEDGAVGVGVKPSPDVGEAAVIDNCVLCSVVCDAHAEVVA